MVRQFFRVAVLQLSLNLLVKGVYLFGIDRVVQNVLPEEDYGLYFALLGFGMLLQVIADFGLQLYNSRILSGHRQLLAKYFPYFIGLKMVLGLLFFGALLLLGLQNIAKRLLSNAEQGGCLLGCHRGGTRTRVQQGKFAKGGSGCGGSPNHRALD